MSTDARGYVNARDNLEAYRALKRELAERKWQVEGRVPGPGGRGFVSKTYGPFDTAHEAAAYGRERRLGGQRVTPVHPA